MIEASFATQYGIRLRQEPDISFAEYLNLLSGLCGETPLGRVVAVRMEKDPKTLKGFGVWEKRIRAEWAQFKTQHLCENNKNHKIKNANAETAQEIFKKLFLSG